MKKIFKTVGICLIACLVFSCTSDDNSVKEENPGGENPGGENPGGENPGETITLWVLDKVEEKIYDSKYNEEGEVIGSELFSITNYVFNYDEKGRIGTVDVDQLDEIPFPEESHYITRATVTYNDKNQITRLYTVDTQNGEAWYDEKMEYNGEGQLIKTVESVDGETKFFQYNAKNQVATLKILDDSGHVLNYTYEYDSRGNIARAAADNEFHVFSYDDKKNPYTHMSMNLSYDDFEYTYGLTVLKIGTNNITSYTDDRGEVWLRELEYNAEGYPTKAKAYFKNDRTIVGSTYSYTYKTITVAK